MQRVHGAEIEFGAAIASNGHRAPPEDACVLIMRAIREQIPHLGAASSGGVFFENGGCFYLDSGGHPELCTPEVDHPTDCVRYLLAGERMLQEVIASIEGPDGAPPPITLFKCNVDYLQPGVTWAFHESYEHQADNSGLAEDLIPHLASRVYLGAGGLDPSSPGIRFSLSPRLHYFKTNVSGSSTHQRGLFHTRNESHSSDRSRLHVICGDSLCSQTALWLRMATTTLVVALAEAGLAPGRRVRLHHAPSAMHTFAADPTLRATAPLRDGRHLSAIDIQWHYLLCAEKHLEHRCMPDWAEDAVRRWRAVLERAEQGHSALDRTLDWAIKHRLMTAYVRRRGIDPVTLPHWSTVLNQLRAAARRLKCRKRVDADLILASRSPLRDERQRLQLFMQMHGLVWEQIREVLALRPQLCEIDLRYGMIHPTGLFETLEPTLDHQIAGVEPVDPARCEPPARTRAAIRGRFVRRFSRSRRNQNALADWQVICTASGHRLIMPHSSGANARWHRRTLRHDRLMLMLGELSTHYNRGDMEQCHAMVTRLLNRRLGGPHPVPLTLRRYAAWVHARRGDLHRAIEQLQAMGAEGVSEEGLAMEYVAVYRFHGLGPSRPELTAWIERGDALLEEQALDGSARVNFLGHKGYVLGRRGELARAERTLRLACTDRSLSMNQQRFQARSFADLGDVLRLRGRLDDAERWLDRAEVVLQGRRFPGERADALLTTRAKLLRDQGRIDQARTRLRRARTVQRQLGGRIALARSVLLDARMSPTRITAARRLREINQLRTEVPDLGSDPMLERILDRWPDWWQGGGADPTGDFFWML